MSMLHWCTHKHAKINIATLSLENIAKVGILYALALDNQSPT